MNDELLLFISSKMVELAPERQLLFELIPTLGSETLPLRAWVFEDDAPASNKTIREVYLKALEEAWLYVGLFWNDYGEWTIDEFNKATDWGKPRLIFVKDVDADKRDPRLTEFLNMEQGVISGVTMKWFKTLDDLKEAVTDSIREALRDQLMRRASTSATLIQDPDDIAELPHEFVGRASLIAEAQEALAKNKRLVLQGFGGMGKTALAARLAELQFAAKPNSKILWMRIGSDSAQALYEGLARPFNAQQHFAQLSNNDERRQALRQLLRQENVDWVILDEISQAIPRQTQLIVTSRSRMPIDGNQMLPVARLGPTEALELLGNHWGKSAETETDADMLCQKLGYHAYALEIAGKTLATLNLTPTKLIAQIKDAPMC